MKTIAVDVGGTNFRIGIFDKKLGIDDVRRLKTPNFINHSVLPIDNLQKLLVEMLTDQIKAYRKKYNFINSIGLSFPAAITSEGITHKVPTIWGAEGANYPLHERLNNCIPDVKWVIANDITAAANRYGRMQKYKTVDYLCVITVSSGIGSKVYDVQSKKVILDKMSFGGELGHVQYDLSKKSPICDCGGRGHIACFSSGRAVERTARIMAKKAPDKFIQSLLGKLCQEPEKITNHKFVEAAQLHDKFTLSILDKTTFPLAYSMSYLSGSIGVGKFIMTGGFALNLGESYIDTHAFTGVVLN
jgi:C7-cyclitol 7-kinase